MFSDLPFPAAWGARPPARPVVGIASAQTRAESPIAQPAPDRLAAGISSEAGGIELSDELWVLAGTDAAPGPIGDVVAAAVAVGGDIVGGLPETGAYQVRFQSPGNLVARSAALAA